MKLSIWLVLACAAPLSTACGAWGVSASASEPVGYVDVTSAPMDIDEAPQTVYEGRTVYLSGDRWYYRDGARWRYYRQEPAALQQHRQQFRKQPPARRQEQRRPEQRTREPQRQQEQRHQRR